MLTPQRTHRGRLIVFEGPDGIGKTTVSKLLADEIRRRGQACCWLAFPGHEPDTLGAAVYAWHHDERFARVPAISCQLLHVAAHIDAIERIIRPALQRGEWVVLDRYWWSTWAYGLAEGASSRELDLALCIERARWRKIQPEIIFLLQRVPPRKKGNKSHEALVRRYRALARRESCAHPVEVVRNEGTPTETLRKLTVRLFHDNNDHQ